MYLIQCYHIATPTVVCISTYLSHSPIHIKISQQAYLGCESTAAWHLLLQ